MRIASIVAFLLTTFALTFSAERVAAQTVSFKTSSGQVFVFKKVDLLDCAGLESVLAEITGADYRAIGRTPPKHPGDRALYDYEDRASRRLARQCGAAPKAQSFGRVQRGSNWYWGR